jgi:virginiamycin B lyase
MGTLAPFRVALCTSVATALLAGCGGSQPPIGTPRGTLLLSKASNRASPVIKEYPIKNEHLVGPLAVAFDASNNLWFNAFYYYLGRRDPKGLITPHSLHVDKKFDSYGSMTAGPRGDVCFSDYAGNVGKIEPDGKIDLYFKHESSIKAGLVITHGYLWVVLSGYINSAVDQVTVDGKLVKQIVLPGYYCYPGPIGASKDGTLWVGYSGNCPAIVRVTESGETTEFPIAAADGVWSVVNGPDGNMWFTAGDDQTTNDYVGKITPDGQITEYPLPNQASGMVVGPDGNWWLTMPWVGKIAVMSQEGNLLREYTLPNAVNGSQPKYQLGTIVLGRDGNLWFPEGYRNKIGELEF